MLITLGHIGQFQHCGQAWLLILCWTLMGIILPVLSDDDFDFEYLCPATKLLAPSGCGSTFLEKRGVARLERDTDGQISSEVESFVDRNEPFVWRKCLSLEDHRNLVSWWDEDANLIMKEGDAIVRVRVAPRHMNTTKSGQIPSEATHFQRFGRTSNAQYRHDNMTLRQFLQIHDDPYSSIHAYAAQIDLSKSLPGLLPYVPEISTEALNAIGPAEQQTIYIGQGTKTQLHYDSRENFVCVLSGGKKLFTLYDPVTSAALLYLDAKEYANTSPIEDHGDLVLTYPMAKYALPVTVTLYAGDCLYLPIYWFHSVESSPDDPRSISVNWWRQPNVVKKDIIGRLLCGQAHRTASARC